MCYYKNWFGWFIYEDRKINISFEKISEKDRKGNPNPNSSADLDKPEFIE